MVNVKAVGVLDCRTYITEKFGAEAHDKIKAVMLERDRDLIYSEALSPLSWVDLHAVLNHAICMDQVLGAGDGRACAAMLRELASRHYNGIYRILLQSPTPKGVVKKSASIWSRYYDKGEASAEFRDDNHAIVTIVGCPDLPRQHELLLIPYMETVLGLAGLNEARIEHRRCVARGADDCVFDYRWK